MGVHRWLLLVIVSIAYACAGPDDGTIPIRVAVGMALDDPTGVAAEGFRERLSGELSGVNVRVFPRGTLGSETEAMEAALAGEIDVVALSNVVLANLVPELHVLDLPFGLTSPDHAWRVLDGPIGAELDLLLLERGLRVVGWAYAGSRQLMFRNDSVRSPDGVRGMKLRVPANPIYAETVEAWGATSTTVAWPEVYLALSQGVVDGIETAPGPSFDQKHYEVADYLVRTDHLIYFHVWLISERSYRRWPEAVQAAVVTAAREAALLNRRLRLDEETLIFRKFQERGVTVIKPDVEAFARLVAPVVLEHGREHRTLLERIEALE